MSATDRETYSDDKYPDAAITPPKKKKKKKKKGTERSVYPINPVNNEMFTT